MHRADLPRQQRERREEQRHRRRVDEAVLALQHRELRRRIRRVAVQIRVARDAEDLEVVGVPVMERRQDEQDEERRQDVQHERLGRLPEGEQQRVGAHPAAFARRTKSTACASLATAAKRGLRAIRFSAEPCRSTKNDLRPRHVDVPAGLAQEKVDVRRLVALRERVDRVADLDRAAAQRHLLGEHVLGRGSGCRPPPGSPARRAASTHRSSPARARARRRRSPRPQRRRAASRGRSPRGQCRARARPPAQRPASATPRSAPRAR